jgi:ABC-type phosphate transport system permease subunit
MSQNTVWTIGIIGFAFILGLLGWVGDAYSSTTGTVLLIVFILPAIAVRIMSWLKR